MASNYDNLPFNLDDAETKIMVDAAIGWVKENTILEINSDEELPSNVKLFVIRFCDLMANATGVASESLGGMSQSFSLSGGTGLLLRDLAAELFGPDYKGKNHFIAAESRWKP